MDTKLKNRHKLAIILIILIIFVPMCIVTTMYTDAYEYTKQLQEETWKDALSSEDFLGEFIRAGHILYSLEHRGNGDHWQSFNDAKENLRENFPDWMNTFDTLYPYMDYVVEDENGTVITENPSGTASSWNNRDIISGQYDLFIRISYDENGDPQADVIVGDDREKQNIVLRELLNQPEIYYDMASQIYGYLALDEYEEEFESEEGYDEAYENYMPKNRTFLYGMTESNLKYYVGSVHYAEPVFSDEIVNAALLLIILVAALALLLPRVKSFHTGEERLFCIPVEIPLVVCFVLFILVFGDIDRRVVESRGFAEITDWLLWFLLFGAVYSTAANLRGIFKMGVKEYLKERSFLLRYKDKIKSTCKDSWNKVYRSLENIDFQNHKNEFVLNIVLVNFAIMLLVCLMWYYGISALIIYSFLLFLLLRKYFNDLREKYQLLLKAVNEIAEGNLDVEITEDLGVFRPFKAEIEKIQHGFKNAVEKEVKSQRMKTELITNVSHDLKTPLTAIITYVDLLKNEPDEEKRREYLEVLERKSLRLKVLIEDLFEISKANSENVTLELVDVDIVHLFKQVKLELEDKIAGANLDFKCSYPEEKVMVRLDSQKTYRIFENLLVNIVKYSMPHTRVYVEIRKDGEHVIVRMKNISAEELNFSSDEITERFVRGDAARNTEGSGLGLAIVKSFVELQKGTFLVGTEADLFKVEIKF